MKEKIGIAIIIIAIVAGIFIMFKDYNDNKPLESTNKKTYEIKREEYTIYKENDDGKYIEDTSKDLVISNYHLNTNETYCKDSNENKIKNIVTIVNNKIQVSSDKTVYCYLYFDKN